MTEAQLLAFIGAAAVKGTIILALAGIVDASWRSASASARHLVWTIAVASALTLPLIGAAISRLNGPTIEIAAPKISAWTAVAASTPVSAPSPAAAARYDYSVTTSDADFPAPIATSEVTRAPAVAVHVAVANDSDAAMPAPVEVATQSLLEPAQTQAISASVVNLLTSDWRRTAFYIWIAGVLLALLPLVTARIQVAVLTRRARLARDGRWNRLIESTPCISHLAGRVRIIERDGAAMPMTWGILRPTLLVPSNAERWPEWQCRNILLHELAHVERRDCLTQLIAQVACALYWFNPLVWIASHRMRVERELACDDRVISAGSRASDYASNLLDVARTLRAPSYTSPTAIAMARPTQLSGRLLAVLDTNRNRRSVTRRAAAAVSFSAIAIVLPLASLVPGTAAATLIEAPSAIPHSVNEIAVSNEGASGITEPLVALAGAPMAIVRATQLPSVGLVGAAAELPQHRATLSRPVGLVAPLAQDALCWEDGEGNTNISVHSDDGKRGTETYSVKYTRNNCSLEMRADGKFTLRADLSDVESLTNDGWFRLEERIGRNSRRIEIRRGSGGALEHLYWVNGDRAQFDNQARAWLARTLLSIERRTAFAASTRVPQLYRSGGLRGVLSEISLMPSAYGKSKYYGSLLDMDIPLDANTLNNVVRQVSTDLSSSDYYMSEVLSKFSTQRSANESTWRAFAEAAGRMKSDYYKSQTLKKVLGKGQLSSETVGILLRSASTMESDYYLSELLKSVAGRYALNAQTRTYYIDALRRIESDYYRGDLLRAIGNDDSWDAQTSNFVLASVADMKSDYYRSQALINLVKTKHVADWPAFFTAAAGIESDYYKRETLLSALRQTPVSREVVSGVLGVAARMRSDSEIAELLKQVVAAYRIDDSLKPAFDKAVDAMDSDYYRGSVLSAARRSGVR